MSEERDRPVFYIVAGEASGDRHGAALAAALTRSYDSCSICGVGGKHLRAAGQEQLFDLAVHAVVGVTDVLRHYFKFRGFFGRILRDIDEKKPDAVIFVDFPGFNLRLAKALRRRHPELKLIYYISPQVWAWKSERAALMADILDLLLVILPFEKDWFTSHAPELRVEWVGHPLLDRWNPPDPSQAGEGKDACRIALLPGSRQREIEAHFPIMIQTAALLKIYHPKLEFIAVAASAEADRQMREVLKVFPTVDFKIEIVSGYLMTELSRCSLGLVSSGTATLECAMAGLPMLVVYKVNPITYAIGKRLVNLEHLSLVNLLAEEAIVPEFLQDEAEPRALTATCRRLLDDPDLLEGMRYSLRDVIGKLGPPGANERAAQAIRRLLA